MKAALFAVGCMPLLDCAALEADLFVVRLLAAARINLAIVPLNFCIEMLRACLQTDKS
jgi:hypothetical protein